MTTQQTAPTFLELFFQLQMKSGTTLVPKRPTLAVVGAAFSDDPVNGVTTMTVDGGAGAGQANLVLVAGLNSNVETDGSVLQRIALSGEGGPYAIGGIVPSAGVFGGKPLMLSDTSGEPFTLVNEDLASTAGFRIRTPNGKAVTVWPGQTGSFQLYYDTTIERFVVTHNGAHYPDGPSVADFGATGDGTDQTAALALAASYAAANHCALLFPPGLYKYSSPLVFDGSTGVHLIGKGGRNAVNGVELRYTGHGSAAALSAVSTTGFGIRGMRCTAVPTTSTFTGYIVDISGTAIAPSSYATFEHAGFDGTATGSLFRTRQGFGHRWEKVALGACLVGVKGLEYGGDFCNQYAFTSVTTESSAASGGTYYSNPGVAWTIHGDITEPLVTGAASGIVSAGTSASGTTATMAIALGVVTLTGLSGITPLVSVMTLSNAANGGNNGEKDVAYVSPTSVSFAQTTETLPDANNGAIHWSATMTARCSGLDVSGCYFGDSTGGGKDINVIGDGINIHGNYFADKAASKTAIKLGGDGGYSTTGVQIGGNTFAGLAVGVDWGTGVVQEGFSAANSFPNTTTRHTGHPVIGKLLDAVDGGGNPQSLTFTTQRFRVHLASDTATSSSWQTVPLDAADFDPGTSYSAHGFKAPVAGYYAVTGFAQTDMASGYVEVALAVNGTRLEQGGGIGPSTGSNAGAGLSDLVFLAAGDVLTLQCYISTGTPHFQGTVCALSAHYMSS